MRAAGGHRAFRGSTRGPGAGGPQLHWGVGRRGGDLRGHGQYGSGGTATAERNASGIRLLGVDPAMRGQGVGRALTLACIDLAREQGHAQVILHTTEAMRIAWGLYERLGFVRAEDLDFAQQGLPVFGFRLRLTSG